MSGYCFDTDVLSALLSREPPVHVVRRVASVPADDQATTAITAAELRYGVAKRGNESLGRLVEGLLASSTILPFDAEAAAVYGPLRAELEREGRPAPPADLQIASIAMARGLVMVTGNVRHFATIPGLVVEDWLSLP